MPDNNRKVISPTMLDNLNSIYYFEYDKIYDVVITHLRHYNKVTIHDAKKPFIIICKKYNKKITFNIDAITIWKSFVDDKDLSGFSLFNVLNMVNQLKIMYQEPTREKVIDMLKNNFHGIENINEEN